MQRLFFARSGWFGSNPVVPVLWAGDQRTSFQRDDGLFTVIPMGINLGLAGVSTYGHDIAGYQSGTNPPANKELFFRWTTLGTPCISRPGAGWPLKREPRSPGQPISRVRTRAGQMGVNQL